MNADLWNRSREVFEGALRVGTSRRIAFVNEACSSDPSLREFVLTLLGGQARISGFLEPNAALRAVQDELLETAGLSAELRARMESAGEVIGLRLSERYELVERIGGGVSGVVYRASDHVAGQDVAIKWFDAGPPSDCVAAHREIPAMRLLRIPGVVRMLDEGVHEGCAYIVMELVSGSPFPGSGVDPYGDGFRATLVGLLETLDRVHRAGFVHCDLKPDNVLVRADGVPVILDLGFAVHPFELHGDRHVAAAAGTLPYLAPEVLEGARADPSADLFAVGAMLFEVLTGSPPRPPEGIEGLGRPLPRTPAPEVSELVPGCPAPLARLVDRLLRTRPEERPGSATEALHVLGFEGRRPRGVQELPWLGDDGVVRRLVRAASRGESVDFRGPSGSGRSRCLREAARELEHGGTRAVHLRPERGGPFALQALLEQDDSSALDDLERARASARRQLEHHLARGDAVLVDDVEHLDSWSARTLEECRGKGAVLRALRVEGTEASDLSPLTSADLVPLFRGPDRIFHQREEAASLLHRRTGGLARRVVEELDSWLRADLARWECGSIVLRLSLIHI